MPFFCVGISIQGDPPGNHKSRNWFPYVQKVSPWASRTKTTQKGLPSKESIPMCQNRRAPAKRTVFLNCNCSNGQLPQKQRSAGFAWVSSRFSNVEGCNHRVRCSRQQHEGSGLTNKDLSQQTHLLHMISPNKSADLFQKWKGGIHRK